VFLIFIKKNSVIIGGLSIKLSYLLKLIIILLIGYSEVIFFFIRCSVCSFFNVKTILSVSQVTEIIGCFPAETIEKP